MNRKIFMLYELSPCERGRVTDIFTRGEMRRRFMDMGIVKGTVMTCLLRSPKGDISAYLIRGAVIAIRRDDAGEIFIEKIKE